MERKKIIIIITIVSCEKKEDHYDHDQYDVMMIRIILRINMNDVIEGPRRRDGSIEMK